MTEKFFANGNGTELSRLREATRELLERDLEAPQASPEPAGRVTQDLSRQTRQWVEDLRAHHSEVQAFLLEAVHSGRSVAG